jgi:aconitate hydratase
LADNLLLEVVTVIHDPVTTTDELIPSGETSSYRSNPLGLAEFTLSRKDPAYVANAKRVHGLENARQGGQNPFESDESLAAAWRLLQTPAAEQAKTGIGSAIFAVKPGDGSAREQAASCQRVLGGAANFANEYATKRYRSNLINWGMLPFLCEGAPFEKADLVYVPGIRRALEEKRGKLEAVVISKGEAKKIELGLGALTDTEREIILRGCLINYYAASN